jgi:Tfp pilus assembly protein PilO
MSSRVLPVIAVILALGIFFTYVHPVWTGPIAETKVAIENNVKALAAAEQYQKEQDLLTSRRNEIDPANLDRLMKFLPDSVDNVGIILDVNALAARSGLALSNIDVKSNSSSASAQTPNPDGTLPVAGSNPVGSVDLSLSAVGTYSALQSFLEGIEKSARLLDVREVKVKGSETGVYTYQMVIRLYWLR